MIRWVLVFAVAVVAAGALYFGLRAGDDGSGLDDRPPAVSTSEGGAGAGQGGDEPAGGGSQPDGSAGDGNGPALPESSCPPDLANCVVASGRVIFVEAVDPDGDGDAHFITDSEDGVSAPGMTIFDVRADLRPDPLPKVGDLVGGAGPVFRGSYGQKQIEVVEFHVAR